MYDFCRYKVLRTDHYTTLYASVAYLVDNEACNAQESKDFVSKKQIDSHSGNDNSIHV